MLLRGVVLLAMLVSIERTALDSVLLGMSPDETDAVPPMAKLTLEARGLHKVTSDRMALIAYLLTKPLIGNVLSLEGAEVPAYMAASLQEDFGTQEFFPSPVSNSTKAIAHGDARSQNWTFVHDQSPRLGGHITVARAHFGYELFGLGEAAYSRIYTNLHLYCVLTGDDAGIRERAIVAVLICDMHQGYQIVFDSPAFPKTKIMKLLGLIGMHRGSRAI
jgi:hypothetical protein